MDDGSEGDHRDAGSGPGAEKGPTTPEPAPPPPPAASNEVTEGPRPANGPDETDDDVVLLPRRRHLYRSSESTRVPPHGYRCRVSIEFDGRMYTGEWEGPDVPGARAEIAARATLDALNRAEGDRVALALKAARVLRVFDDPLVVVGVYGLNNTEATPLAGAVFVRDALEEAAILATLQATDRWIAREVAPL